MTGHLITSLDSAASNVFVESDHACATKPEIVLKADLRAFHLSGPSRAAQLPRQFVALGEPRSAQRMAFRQQATGRICDDPASIGVVSFSMKRAASPSLHKPKPS